MRWWLTNDLVGKWVERSSTNFQALEIIIVYVMLLGVTRKILVLDAVDIFSMIAKNSLLLASNDSFYFPESSSMDSIISWVLITCLRTGLPLAVYFVGPSMGAVLIEYLLMWFRRESMKYLSSSGSVSLRVCLLASRPLAADSAVTSPVEFKYRSRFSTSAMF